MTDTAFISVYPMGLTPIHNDIIVNFIDKRDDIQKHSNLLQIYALSKAL